MYTNCRYIRKTSPELTLKLWKIFEPKECYSSDPQLMESIISQLSDLFPKHTIDEDFCCKLIKNALKDKLLVEDIGSGSQLSRIKPSFNRISFGDLTNDWFCFECHSCDQNQPLIDCKTCFRAIHQKCLKTKVNSNDFRCDYCLNCKQIDKSLKINRLNRKSLNGFFGLVLKCLEKSIDNFDIYSEYGLEVNHMSNVLIFNYLDLNRIKSKVISEKYENICEFENDFKHFVHNFLVYRMEGLDSDFESFLEIHLTHLKSCSDCYNYAYNEKFKNSEEPYEWFIKVCDPPHPLVYARSNANQPFWPSKVIQTFPDNEYCVQFFDTPRFERSYVNIVLTKPIDYIFHRQKFKDNRFRQSLRLLSMHLQKLIDSGFDINSQYTKTLNYFKTIGILEPFIPKKSIPESQLKTKKKKISVKKKIRTQSVVDFEDHLPETEVSDNSENVVNESAGTSSQINKTMDKININSNELSAETVGENDSPLSKVLNSDDLPIETKFKICNLFIKKAINQLKSIQTFQ